MAEELKAAFEVTDSVDLEEWLSNKVSPLTFPITSSLTPITTTALDVTNNVFTISPPSGDKGYAGQWRWIGVGVNVVNRPSWLRRTTVSVLLGEEWVEEGGSKAKVKETPLPSEYTRWDEFLSETQ